MRHYLGMAATIILAGLLAVVLTGCPQPPTQPDDGAAVPPAEPKATPDATAAEGVGEKAPDFTVTDVDGKTHSLSSYSGKILVVDFWATYCKPCIEHLRDYNTYADEFSRQGAEFLALSMDESDAVIKGWRPEGFRIPLARLDPKTRQAFFGNAAIVPIPQVRIVDRKGILRYSFGPDATSEQVEEAVKTLLAEK